MKPQFRLVLGKFVNLMAMVLLISFLNYPSVVLGEGWSYMSSFPGDFDDPTLSRNSYFYTLGPGGYERSTINSDGTLSNWTVALWSSGGLAYIGGAVSTTANLIYESGGGSQLAFAPLAGLIAYVGYNPDGTLTNPVVQHNPIMQSPRELHASIILNGNLYLFGGYSTNLPPSGALSSVEFGPINADSSVGPFQYTSSFSQISGAVSLAWSFGNSVYCLGIRDVGSTPTTFIERSTVQPNGTLSSWTVIGGPYQISGNAVLTSRTTLFVISGSNGQTVNPTYQTGFEPASNVVGNFVPVPSTLVPHPSGDIGTWDRFVYCLGGYNNGTIHITEIYDPDLADTGLFPDKDISLHSPSQLQIKEILLPSN